MDLEKRLEIYQSEYYFQIDFKEKLYARMAIYAVLITACITANMSIFDPLITSSGWLLTFSIFLWLVSISVMLFILYGFLCISHIKQDNWINTNSDMEAYRNTLVKHFDQHYQDDSTGSDNSAPRKIYVDEQFSLYLVEQFSTCSTVIRDNNVYRQRWLSWIMTCTYIFLLETGMLGLLFLYEKI